MYVHLRCSFIATRVIPRLARLAKQQEQAAQQQFEALQQQELLLLQQQMQAEEQQRHEGSLLQHVQGIHTHKKFVLQRSRGFYLQEQQQLHALLGLRVPVVAAAGPAAEAAAAEAAAKARTLAQQTREVP